MALSNDYGEPFDPWQDPNFNPYPKAAGALGNETATDPTRPTSTTAPNPYPIPSTAAPGPISGARNYGDPNAPGYTPYGQLDEGDIERRVKEMAARSGVAYDKSDLEDVFRAYYNSGPNGGQGGNLDQALQVASNKYNQRAGNAAGGGDNSTSRRMQDIASAYGGGQSGSGDLISYLRERDQANEARMGSVRQMLMDSLGQASRPVSENDPGIREVLAGQRLAGQRGAERQRSILAERLAAEGLSDSGAMNTGIQGIEQNRAENDVRATGAALTGELTQRRNQLQNLLALAVQSGDAQSARSIQAQLQLMDMQLRDSQFGRQLQYQYDQLGTDSAFKTAGLNQSFLLALLNGAL